MLKLRFEERSLQLKCHLRPGLAPSPPPAIHPRLNPPHHPAQNPQTLLPHLPQADICDFLKTAQANREMAAVIRKLQVGVAGRPQPSAPAPGAVRGCPPKAWLAFGGLFCWDRGLGGLTRRSAVHSQPIRFGARLRRCSLLAGGGGEGQGGSGQG